MRLVILWFGLWKNGESTYVPEWVKADTKRFIRACYPGGVPSETISPLCQEAVEADKRAFTKFMEFLKEKTKKPRPYWQFRWKRDRIFRIGQRLFSSGRNCLPGTGTRNSGSGRCCFLGSPVRRRCSGNVYGMALRQCSRDHCVSRKTGVSSADVCECLLNQVSGTVPEIIQAEAPLPEMYRYGKKQRRTLMSLRRTFICLILTECAKNMPNRAAHF